MIKDMLAGLTDFQEGKNAYTLHLNMAQECMKHFQERKLLEVSSVEQCLATGFDENYKKAKNLGSQLVQLLDDESIQRADRLRLVMLYIMYRNGLLPSDIRKLLAHAQLPPQSGEAISNLDLLGVKVEKALKEAKSQTATPQPLFARKPPSTAETDETGLSRYELNLKLMLEEQIRGILDPTVFPYTRPHTDSDSTLTHDGAGGLSQASLRSAKPTWARTRSSADQPRQRLIVLMAGGATYAEARACYEISQSFGKDVFLATSHMLTPGLFLRQLGDLSVDKRRLDIPAERPKPVAPAHLFEKEPPPPVQPVQQPVASSAVPSHHHHQQTQPPTAHMGKMSLGSAPTAPAPNGSSSPAVSDGKLKKEKKRHHFFR